MNRVASKPAQEAVTKGLDMPLIPFGASWSGIASRSTRTGWAPRHRRAIRVPKVPQEKWALLTFEWVREDRATV